MSNEKFSPQLLRSILESDGVDTSDMDGMPTLTSSGQPEIKTLDALERKKALRQLTSLISQFRSASGSLDDFISFRLDELPDILRLLAELAAEAKVDDKNREEKKKVLHVAAAMLRRMLHMPDANHYRVLGLKVGASPAQIEEHYQLLHKLFWFDGSIDPQRKSRLRISEAYTVLKQPESRYRYDEDLAWLEQQELRSVTGGRKGGVWRLIAAALLVALGLSGVFLYFDKGPDTNMATLPEKNIQLQAEKGSELDIARIDEIPVITDSEPLLQDSVSKSSQNEVSVPEDDVLRQEIQEVISEQPGSGIGPGVPSGTPQPPEKKPTVKPDKTKLTGKSVLVNREDISSVQITTRGEEVVRPRDYSEQPAKKIPARKFDISQPERAVPVRKQHDRVTTVITPPVVKFPEASLVIPPRIGMHGTSDTGTTTQTEQSSVSSAIENPEDVHPAAKKTVQPALVVIGSPRLSVDSLTKKQVRDIFLGKRSRLPSGERVTVVISQGDGSLKAAFYRDVIGKTPRQLKIHWAKVRFQGKTQPPEHLVDDAAVKDKVAHSSGVIGIVKNSEVDDSVKILLNAGNETN